MPSEHVSLHLQALTSALPAPFSDLNMRAPKTQYRTTPSTARDFKVSSLNQTVTPDPRLSLGSNVLSPKAVNDNVSNSFKTSRDLYDNQRIKSAKLHGSNNNVWTAKAPDHVDVSSPETSLLSNNVAAKPQLGIASSRWAVTDGVVPKTSPIRTRSGASLAKEASLNRQIEENEQRSKQQAEQIKKTIENNSISGSSSRTAPLFAPKSHSTNENNPPVSKMVNIGNHAPKPNINVGRRITHVGESIADSNTSKVTTASIQSQGGHLNSKTSTEAETVVTKRVNHEAWIENMTKVGTNLSQCLLSRRALETEEMFAERCRLFDNARDIEELQRIELLLNDVDGATKRFMKLSISDTTNVHLRPVNGTNTIPDEESVKELDKHNKTDHVDTNLAGASVQKAENSTKVSPTSTTSTRINTNMPEKKSALLQSKPLEQTPKPSISEASYGRQKTTDTVQPEKQVHWDPTVTKDVEKKNEAGAQELDVKIAATDSGPVNAWPKPEPRTHGRECPTIIHKSAH